MKKRCPNARPVFQLKGEKINELKHWKLRFNRYANIIRSRNNKVPIGLWKITKKCEVDLDKYEQFPKVYKKIYISFLSKKVLVYVMRNKTKIKPTKKSLGVLNILVKSLIERPSPNPSIINARTIGAILVTISIIYFAI